MQLWALYAFIGLVAGFAAFKLVPGNYRGGVWATMAVGAIAAVGGAVIGREIGMATQSSGAIAAVISAAVILVLWRTFGSRAA